MRTQQTITICGQKPGARDWNRHLRTMWSRINQSCDADVVGREIFEPQRPHAGEPLAKSAFFDPLSIQRHRRVDGHEERDLDEQRSRSACGPCRDCRAGRPVALPTSDPRRHVIEGDVIAAEQPIAVVAVRGFWLSHPEEMPSVDRRKGRNVSCGCTSALGIGMACRFKRCHALPRRSPRMNVARR